MTRGRRVLYLGAAPRLVPPVPLNLTEDREENRELRCLCGLLSESRAVKLPQFCYGGRKRGIQHLHHKWPSRRRLRPLPRTAPRAPPDCQQTAPRLPPDCHQTAPRPPGVLQSAPLKSENAECRVQNGNARPPKATPRPYRSHIHATSKPYTSGRHPKDPTKPPQCDPKATLKRLQGSNKAPTKPPRGE
jgi:hypothetical protein